MKTTLVKIARIIKEKKLFFLITLLLLLLLPTSYFIFKRLGLSILERQVYSLPEGGRQYANVFSLVEEKISQSATIKISLPEKTTPNEAQEKIVFTPKIDGQWLPATEEKVLSFRPTKKLEIGKYYSVSLETGDGIIGGDFLVEEDPKIVAIFPKKNSETHEASEISIIFNRPMVALSVLDIMEDQNIPVEINPATPGKFKWISTKTLQFIPETTLIPSANYSVKIKSEFKSLDGVEVNGMEYTFFTRPLRYRYMSQGQTVYNQPIMIAFNQEVDLKKTTKEIWVKNNNDNQQVGFIAEYGKQKTYNEKEEKYEEKEDRSVILVYNKKDRYGREKLWDFSTNYFIMVQKAYPLKGDIVLEEKNEKFFQITGPIASISAESERSSLTRQDFFDPEGKLWVNFYEKIDLSKSLITNDKLVTSGYGEKCRETESGYYSETDCEKEIDKTKAYFIFNKDQVGLEEELKLVFEKITNIEGLTINEEQIIETITSFPKLRIRGSVPATGENFGSLTDLYLCTNSPLTPPADEDIDEYLSLNNDYEFKSWNDSSFVTDSRYSKCQVGEFQTYIGYGLMPETDYQVDVSLQDPFGASARYSVNFRTQKMPNAQLTLYHFQDNFVVSTPDKTKLTYAALNMEYIDLDICRLEPEKMLEYLNRSISYTESGASIVGCTERITKRIELPKKYWIKNYFQIDLKEYTSNLLGSYILSITHPNYTDYKGQQVYERTFLNITNIGVTKKKINIGQVDDPGQKEQIKDLYWITDLKTLESENNAKIKIYQNYYEPTTMERSIRLINEAETGTDGVAEISSENEVTGAVVAKDGDSTIVFDNDNQLSWASSAYTAKRMYTYTDRPIYRPGDQVRIKGISRVGYDGDWQMFNDKPISLQVNDSRGQEITTSTLELSDFGTFQTDITLPTDAPLGQYYIRTDYGYSYFDVQEYVPAPFAVETKTDKEEYLAGETFKLDIDANYYFGAPVDGGTVEYSLASQDYYFDKYQDEYFDFGNGWYYCSEGCEYGDKFILRNKAELDKNGRTKISQSLDFDKMFSDEDRQSKIIVVYLTVKNKNGQSVSAQKSFIVHAGEFYLGLNTDQRFLSKDDTFTLKAKSVNTQGQPIKVENINLSINRVEWLKNKRKEVDGGYYYKWEKKLVPIWQSTVKTDNNGNWQDKLSIPENGEFEIIAKAKDNLGNEIKTSYSIYVYGGSWYDVRPTNDTSLEIIADKTELKTGDTGTVIIKSPYEKARALISIERGRVFAYNIVDVEQGLFKYEFKIEDNYAPNVYVSATLLSGKPEVKYGSQIFHVDTEKKELEIEIKANKDIYLPGEEVNLEISARDKNGQPQEAEISIAVADLSVLALKGNPKKNPLVFFYGNFPLAVSTVSNFKSILYETDIPQNAKGGGGAEAEDLAKKKRGEFRDTAFWKADVRTGKNGQAKVSFILPDNLTTWQIESVALTKDLKLGTDYQEFKARKELMVSPLKPRFIIPGDEFSVGAKIFNQSDREQILEVELANTSLELLEEGVKKIALGENESVTIYFKVKAPENIREGNHNFTLSARNSRLEDTVEQSIKIGENNTYETTSASGQSANDQVNEYIFLPENIVPDKGGLEINTSATLAVFLSDALNYLLAYPYGCAEQISSKLDAVATVKNGLNLENIGDKFELSEISFNGQSYTIDQLADIGLQELYKNQKEDGGFGYYPESYSSGFSLSLHIAETLNDLKKAGYQVKEEVMKKLYFYINSSIQNNIQNLRNNYSYYENKDLKIITAYVLSQLKDYGNINQWLINEITALEKDKAFLNENISNISLAHLAMLLAENPEIWKDSFKKTVFNILENRIEIDSRGAFLGVKEYNFFWEYHETSIKNTSLLLSALIKEKNDNALFERILRWLLRSRAKDGSWGSTNNTISAIKAMTDYLVFKEENQAEFNLKIELNHKELETFSYSAENILDQNSLSLTTAELGLGNLNTISFLKSDIGTKADNFYYDLALKYYLPIDSIAPRDEGFTITRNLYKIDDKYYENPVQIAEVGDVLKGHIEITLPKDRNFVAIEDYIPAGVELINFDLATENLNAIEGYYNEDVNQNESYDYWYDYYYRSWEENRKLRPDVKELKDDRLFLWKERLDKGTYEFDYYVRALVPGKFNALPANVNEMYFPENFGRTNGDWFVINEKEHK